MRGHIDFETLVRYWLGELDATANADVDEHLLGCERCGRQFDAVVALADGIRDAFAQGALHAFVTEGFLRGLDESGAQVRQYRVAPGGSVNCTMLPEDRYVAARMEAPLDGVARVDAIVDVEGSAQTFRDIPFDSARGTVVLLPRPATLREMPSHRTQIRLVAVEGAAERELGTYTFNHVRPVT